MRLKTIKGDPIFFSLSHPKNKFIWPKWFFFKWFTPPWKDSSVQYIIDDWVVEAHEIEMDQKMLKAERAMILTTKIPIAFIQNDPDHGKRDKK